MHRPSVKQILLATLLAATVCLLAACGYKTDLELPPHEPQENHTGS